RGSSQSSLQDLTYDQLMTMVTKLEGTVATLTDTGDEHDFGIVSDGDILAYMSPRPSYTSPTSTAHKSLSLANRHKLRVRRTSLKLKSPMRCYSRKMRCTLPPPASTTMTSITTISVPMTTRKLLKDTKDAAKDVAKDAAKDTHLDAVTTMSVPMTTTEKLKDTIHIDAAAQDTFCTEDELQFLGKEKGDKPNYALPDLSKIKRNKYPIYSKFEKKKIDCYLDCLPKGVTCEPSFWDTLYPGGVKDEYLEEGKLDGLYINAFIELMMRKRPRNAQWTLGLSELVAFHIDSRKLMSMVLVVDA
nr:hypothetical protein [Tanacetum cinerariifolium]